MDMLQLTSYNAHISSCLNLLVHRLFHSAVLTEEIILQWKTETGSVRIVGIPAET